MRSTADPIAGLKTKLLEWEVVSEDELKQIDNEARDYVDKEVAEAEKMAAPEPVPKILFEDIYVSDRNTALLNVNNLGSWFGAGMDAGKDSR